MKIVLYDALSHLRVRMEKESGGSFMRGLLNEAQQPGIRVWIWDGPGGNAARRKIYPPYKTTRVAKPGVIQNMDFVRELLAMTPVWQCRIPGFEGDDTIAALVEHFLKTTDLPIHIEGRDGDLVANCALSPRVTCAHSVKDRTPAQIRFYKLAVGKTTDTIPGIKGFGKGGWEKADKAGLQSLIYQTLDAQQPLSAEQEGRALSVGLSKASFNWLCVQENIDDLRAMRTVSDPLPIPIEVLNQHLVPGVYSPAKLEATLKEFLF